MKSYKNISWSVNPIDNLIVDSDTQEVIAKVTEVRENSKATHEYLALISKAPVMYEQLKEQRDELKTVKALLSSDNYLVIEIIDKQISKINKVLKSAKP